MPRSAASFPLWRPSSNGGGGLATSCRRHWSKRCWSRPAKSDRSDARIVSRAGAIGCELLQIALAIRRFPRRPPRRKGGRSVFATGILWGQVIGACGILLVAIWTATEWPAWRLGFQRDLGRSWFALWDFTVYPRRRSSGGGSPMTPMRRGSSSGAPISQRLAASSLLPWQSSCRCDAPARPGTPKPTPTPAA